MILVDIEEHLIHSSDDKMQNLDDIKFNPCPTCPIDAKFGHVYGDNTQYPPLQLQYSCD